MADEQDDDQKTFEASARRLEQAREEGQVPISQEVRIWFMLLAGLAVVLMLGPTLARHMREALVVYLSSADQLSLGNGTLRHALFDTMRELGPGLALLGLIFIGAAIAGTMLQTGPFASTHLLEFKFDRINPASGWKRIFSVQSLVEFMKGVLKIGLVGFVVMGVVKPLFSRAELLNGMEPALQLQVIYDYASKLMITVMAVFSVIVGADFVWQRFQFAKRMRMTREDLKQEYKQQEGDPMVRARLAALRRDRSRRRMMSMVKDATVVITNPTHFAVALQYEPGMNAPKVLALGQDNIALKIREVATENEVPLVENPPLARALYAACDLDDEIPVEQFEAVAKVIGFVMSQKGGIRMDGR